MIAGATRPEQIEQNAKAASLEAQSAADVADVDRLTQRG